MTHTVLRCTAPTATVDDAGTTVLVDSTFVLTAEDGAVHRAVLGACDRVIAVGDVLEYDVMPAGVPFDDDGQSASEAAAAERVFAATALAIDLELEGGRRVSEAGLRDHHGFSADVDGQAASRSLRVDRWNRKSIDLSPLAGTRVRAIELTVRAARGVRITGRVASVRVGVPCSGWADAMRGDGVLADVRTTRGSDSSEHYSSGNTVPATALPGGFTLTFPATDKTADGWPYTWGEPGRPQPFEALRFGHTPTPWLGDFGVLQVLPRIVDSVHSDAFMHADELAQPHRYAVRLASGIEIDTSPTEHGAIARFTFPSDVEPELLFDQLSSDGVLQWNAADGHLTGFSDFASPMLIGAPRVWFAIEFDSPVRDVSIGATPGQPVSSAAVSFGSDVASAITMTISTSLLGVEAALRGLGSGAPTLEQARARAADAWTRLLERFRIDGASSDQRTTFYSGLYRMFLYPNRAHEVAADGEPAFADFVNTALATDAAASTTIRRGRISINNGFWDTYRTLWPAYALFSPERAAELLDGFLTHFYVSGWMPRWSAPGAVDIMVGTSSDIVLADALLKGVTIADEEAAILSALRNATASSGHPAVGRTGIERAVHLGYTPESIHESVAWTLEGAINDFGVLRMLERLEASGEVLPDALDVRAYIRYFRSKAGAYAHLFDGQYGFFRPKSGDGDFADAGIRFEPRAWGGAYTETNAWGMRFSAPHDGHGLAALFGGPEAMRGALDEYFGSPELLRPEYEGSYGRRIHEMIEARDVRMGMFALSNQPAHHVPFMYAFTDAPGSTAPIVRAALRRQFLGSEIGQGYPGDEDNGEMSAWYVFAALGFYPLAVGTPWYVLTAPLFGRAEVDVPGGTLLVTTEGDDEGCDWIQGVTFNGVQVDTSFIHHDDLSAGGHLHVTLGRAPGAWPAAAAPEGASLSGPGHAPWLLRQATPDRFAASWGSASGLRDGTSEGDVQVPPSGVLSWEFDEPTAVELCAMTSGSDPRRAPTDWTVECSSDGDDWRPVGAAAGARFRWPRQTVPFSVEPCGHRRFWRIRFGDAAAAELAQVTLLTSAPSGRARAAGVDHP